MGGSIPCAIPPLERMDSKSSTRAVSRNSGNAIPEDEVFFEFGGGGLKVQKMAPTQRMKGQLREIGQTMVQSMTRSFPREVWEACEIPHPDIVREKINAEKKVAKH